MKKYTHKNIKFCWGGKLFVYLPNSFLPLKIQLNNGVTKVLAEWGEFFGIDPQLISEMIKRKGVEDTFLFYIKKHKKTV